MYRFIFALIFITLLPIRLSSAVTVVLCEDEAGNRSYQAICPPDMKVVDKKNLQTKTQPTPVPPDIVPTVYIAPNCKACDLVLQFFQTRGINIEQKSIENNPEVQQELKGVVGSLKVPTILIGDKVLSDYYPSDLVRALTAVGFTGVEQEQRN